MYQEGLAALRSLGAVGDDAVELITVRRLATARVNVLLANGNLMLSSP